MAALRPALLFPALLLLGCSTAPLRPSPGAAPRVVLHESGGDVRALSRKVHGSADPACASILVEGPDGTVLASRSGHSFEAVVPLRPGPNLVRAVCTGAADEGSAEVGFEVRQLAPRTGVGPHHHPDGASGGSLLRSTSSR